MVWKLVSDPYWNIGISDFFSIFCYSSGKSSIVLKDVLILKGEKFIGMLKIGYWYVVTLWPHTDTYFAYLLTFLVLNHRTLVKYARLKSFAVIESAFFHFLAFLDRSYNFHFIWKWKNNANSRKVGQKHVVSNDQHGMKKLLWNVNTLHVCKIFSNSSYQER